MKLQGSAKVLPGLPVGSVGTVAVGKMSCRVVHVKFCGGYERERDARYWMESGLDREMNIV